MPNPKYKIIETTGCTAFDLTINGRSLSEIPESEQEEILDYLFARFKAQLKENTVSFSSFVKMFQYDDYGYDDHKCSSCGDTVSWTTWEI